jgi:hypothetical protein
VAARLLDASPARPPPLLLSVAAVRYAMLSAIRTAPAIAARRVCAMFYTQTREVLNAYLRRSRRPPRVRTTSRN